jgi:SSS family transporter
MAALDMAIIALTLGANFCFALLMRERPQDAQDYFLGRRQLPAWAVMLSIVATETSALTVISLPGIGARGDFAFLQLALGYVLGRIGVALWLLPGYFNPVNGAQQTAYQRLGTRFGLPTRQLLSSIFLVTRFLADGVRIFAGAIPLALLTGWDLSLAIVLMGAVTLAYTFVGGLRAVVWTDALQWSVYVAGGIVALVIAVGMAGGWAATWAAASVAGKLDVFDLQLSLTTPFTLLGGLVGGAMLSAASHGTDHLIVQRLLSTHNLRAAQWALVGSGFVVLLQFTLFLAIGTALWAAGQAPAVLAGDQLFPRFIVQHLPVGVAGLLMAGILAAAMSTISSSISALASSVTNDLYAPWAGKTIERDGAHLLRAGRWFSLAWGLLLTAGALGFVAWAGGKDTPAVLLALSVASITYGALLGSYVLAGWRGRWAARIGGRHVAAGVAVALVTMGGVVTSTALAFVWTVPLGTALTVGVALALATIWPHEPARHPA